MCDAAGHPFARIALDRGSDSAVTAERVHTPAGALLDDAAKVAGIAARDDLDDRALAVASLSLCRQAVDEGVSAAHARLRTRRADLPVADELAGNSLQERVRELNAALRTGGLAEIRLDKALRDALNGASHFDPPETAGRDQRVGWVDEARTLVAALDSCGPATP